MLSRFLAFTIAAGVHVTSSRAAAQASGPADPSLPDEWPERVMPAPSRWYGWQVLIPGAASQLLIGAGLFDMYGDAAWGSRVWLVGVVTNPFGPAIVHWAHGREPVAWASWGIQSGTTVGAVLLHLLVPASANRINGGAAAPAAAAYGVGAASLALLGAGLAVDAAVLSFEPRTAQIPRRSALLLPTVVGLPTGDQGRRRGVALGLAGAF